MAAKKQAVAKPAGRQAAYSARNRAALIKAGQEVLAEIGPSATIEQLASHAEVSPTTIYKYFGNKEELFLEALAAAWNSWLEWAVTQNPSTDRLQRIIELGRRLLRTRQTHPVFAQMLHNSLNDIPDFMIQADQGEGKRVFKFLADAGELKGDDFDQRWVLWANVISGLSRSVLVNEELTPEQADVALGIGLSVWGISDSKAKKLVSRDLGLSLVQ
jgi:AcrR family transcriptional regulator